MRYLVLTGFWCSIVLGASSANAVSNKKNSDSFEEKQELSPQELPSQELTSQKPVETLTVLASRAPQHFTDLNTSNSFISPEDLTLIPTNTLDMLTKVPGVSENGQAGLFQVYSIRGFSRQRVLTYVSDIPLKAERRAGVASSFFHPLLLESADVMRGPASTLYQSGSLGGVIKFKPKFFSGQSFAMDYRTEGNRNSLVYGVGGDSWSFGLARQASNNSEDVFGDELNNAYDQYSLSFISQWFDSGVDYEWLTIASKGDDIGRSSLRYPERLVTVPNEQHFLGQFSAQTDDWRFSLYLHPNEVDTLTVRPGKRKNFASNDSHDFGTHFEKSWSNESFDGLWGLDGFARSSIYASDIETSLADQTQSVMTSLDGATEREFAAFATVNNHIGNTKVQLGARAIQHYQKNKGQDSISDNAFTGFLGGSHPLSKNWFWTASLGTGVRFATVSERFYTGTTGRGAVVGNPNLQKERSISVDTGLKYSDSDKSFAFNVYKQKLHDYIERIEIAPEQLSYRNIADAEVEGWELESRLKLTAVWQIGANAMYVRGKDDAGVSIADIPASRVNFNTNYNGDVWNMAFGLEYRRHKDNIASGERETPTAWIGQISVEYQLNNETSIGFFVDNLFDEEYFTSADDIVPYAEGRDFGLTFKTHW